MRVLNSIILFLLALSLHAQNAINTGNPETNSANWQVTKLANQNQLVRNPNEITIGPDGWLWISERRDENGGGERIVRVNPDTGAKTEMIDLTNEVDSFSGQDGLMGFAIHPDLVANASTISNPYVYIVYTYGTQGNLTLRIERLTYNSSTNSLTRNTPNPFILIDNMVASNDHNSGRMKIGPDHKIYYTSGDLGYNQFRNKCERINSQKLPALSDINSSNHFNNDYTSYQGKILRINLDGSIPSDNPEFIPFTPTDAVPGPPDNTVTSGKVRSHIYTFGHRNAQGIVFASDGTLYSSEHGDRVDDELNIITAGRNYGWPLIVGEYDDAGYSYCIKASDPNGCATGSNDCPAGAVIHDEFDFPLAADFQGPISTYNSTSLSVPQGGFLTWPSVAPSSIDIYEPSGATGEIPWTKTLIIPTLKKGALYRYELNAAGDAVSSDLIEFHSSVDRYRDIAISPDGTTIYAITDSGGNTSGPSGTAPLTPQNPGAVIKIEYIFLPEPSNQPTSFTATATGNDIDLSWTDATGTNTAAGYLITASTNANNLPTLVDGVEQELDDNLSDGDAIIKVLPGEQFYTFNGLTPGETYYFQIHSFSNLGGDIDYLTMPVGPTADDTIQPVPTLYISEMTDTQSSVNSNFVEIYNYGDTAIDLAASGIVLGRNRANSSDFEQALAGTVQPGEYFVIGRSSFLSRYGFNADFTLDSSNNALLGGDGDDTYILVYNGTFLSGTYTTLDIYGEVGVDGTGTAWEYVDSRAVRKRSTAASSTTWISDQWNIVPSLVEGDNTPGEPDAITFEYDNAWTPFDPSGESLPIDNATVINGIAPLNASTDLNNITIQAGSTLDIATGMTLSFYGDLTNNGSMDAGDSTLDAQGSASQSIAGNSLTVGQLSVANDLTVNTDLSILDQLKSVSGTLSTGTGNQIILKSNASTTAFVDEVTGTITADFMVERYVPARRAFRFMSSSVNTAATIRDNWQEAGSSMAGLGTHITGSTSGANGFDTTATGSASLFNFNNTTQQWVAIPNTDATNLQAGTAYRLLVRGDRTVDLTTNTATAIATTLRASGTITTGDVNSSAMSNVSGQFNFIGNPYQAPVDLQTVLNRSTNLNNIDVYLWDPEINARGGYVTVDVTDNSSNVASSVVNKYLQPQSSFFVTTIANGSATVRFRESDKSTSEGIYSLFSVPTRLQVNLYNQQNYTTGVNILDGTTMKIDLQYDNAITYADAVKFANLDESMAIEAADGSLLSVERKQEPLDGDVIQLHHTNYRISNYTLEIVLPQLGVDAYLKDHLNNSYTALNVGVNAYDYSVDANVAGSMDERRFQIVFSNVTLSNDNVSDVASISVYPNPVTGEFITINAGTSNRTLSIVNLYNITGQLVKSYEFSNSQNIQRIDLPAGLSTGTYLIQASFDDGATITEKLVKS